MKVKINGFDVESDVNEIRKLISTEKESSSVGDIVVTATEHREIARQKMSKKNKIWSLDEMEYVKKHYDPENRKESLEQIGEKLGRSPMAIYIVVKDNKWHSLAIKKANGNYDHNNKAKSPNDGRVRLCKKVGLLMRQGHSRKQAWKLATGKGKITKQANNYVFN